MVDAGFYDAELVSETGFNSSPVTKGMLFRATKKTNSKEPPRRKSMKKLLA
jgi:hypothetical protein